MARNYFFGAAAAAGVLPVVLFAAGLTACFLWCFFTFGVVAAAGGLVPLAGGVAGDCANVRGMVATARAIVSKVVFIFFFSLRALAARLQSHHAAYSIETR
jgi:hypothetical protein